MTVLATPGPRKIDNTTTKVSRSRGKTTCCQAYTRWIGQADEATEVCGWCHSEVKGVIA